METSSPLAAMRPAAAHSFGQHDFYRSHPHAHFAGGNPFGSGTLNLREQLSRPKQDYFNAKSIYGSSPTASLAADLSQNFRIDNEASPHFPTPRRNLFSANVMGAVESREYVTTPPLPSSSPAPCDMMDISPLPHKVPFVTQIDIQSPSPASTPGDDMLVESPIPRRLSSETLKPAMVDRRKQGLRRPSLGRGGIFKMNSTGQVPTRPADNHLPAFRFGGECSRAPNTSSSLSLSECFQDSPPQERRPQSATSPTANAPGALQTKIHFSSLTRMNGPRSASPIVGHARRPSNPFNRARKQVRRSLSMFENPGDIMSSKQEEIPTPTLAAVMDIEEPHEPVLPHFFPEGQNDSIPRISRETLVDVLDGKFSGNFDQRMIIDCRFEYEYEGGHIDGAVNCNDKDILSEDLFTTPIDGRTLLIFHCEFSAHRAPIVARHVRSMDRTANAEYYPKLTYPEVYILDGGYSGFFSEHRDRCYPPAYVEMDCKEHAYTCEREMNRIRQARKGLGRAQTFAFGQDRSVEASPTAPGRVSEYDSPCMMMMGASPLMGINRSPARRMASY